MAKTGPLQGPYRDAPLLILDEPSSSLDANTNMRFSAVSGDNKRHDRCIDKPQIKSLSSVDRIYVLDKGKIVESGSHEELLAIEDFTVQCTKTDESVLTAPIESGIFET